MKQFLYFMMFCLIIILSTIIFEVSAADKNSEEQEIITLPEKEYIGECTPKIQKLLKFEKQWSVTKNFLKNLAKKDDDLSRYSDALIHKDVNNDGKPDEMMEITLISDNIRLFKHDTNNDNIADYWRYSVGVPDEARIFTGTSLAGYTVLEQLDTNYDGYVDKIQVFENLELVKILTDTDFDRIFDKTEYFDAMDVNGDWIFSYEISDPDLAKTVSHDGSIAVWKMRQGGGHIFIDPGPKAIWAHYVFLEGKFTEGYSLRFLENDTKNNRKILYVGTLSKTGSIEGKLYRAISPTEWESVGTFNLMRIRRYMVQQNDAVLETARQIRK